MASESTEECVQKLGLDPSEPALVHPFVQTVQLAPWDEGCAETLCIFCSVVMCTCWPLQLIVKSRQQVFFKISRHKLWIQSCSTKKFQSCMWD